MKFLNLILLIITFSSCKKVEDITYDIELLSGNQLILSFQNNSDSNYYFSFKGINQPDNPGPNYIGFKVVKIIEEENLDSLRKLAHTNYISASKKNGLPTQFTFSEEEEKEYLKQKYFFIKSHSSIDIFLKAETNEEHFTKFPIVLENYEFHSIRKKVTDDFYAYGKIGTFQPYQKKILNSD